ncbi:hypothetical protein EDB89DRAFT_1840925 [Lactarius sanguifluus]|nr:hypothetical protein EDB89DRAFT_1840925 [Lactarius sanguifluus]
MSSWFPSWFTLPTFDVSIFPNLQRKFVSFILKRFLGHLLKPGQLDVEQIDSAIGSGNVTINDLELDCTSVNALLSGLPIQLHDGSIASVSARIPWPNPLTNGVELSVRSLHLVFHLLPRVAKDTRLPSTNLADSISDAAQSFAHEEITHDESTEVHQALKSRGSPSFGTGDNYVPGGLDASSEDPGVQPDVDPTGISMFASMIEYLLSQFTFSAEDINITVIYPGHSSFRFKVSRIHYGRPTSSPRESTRTIEISGVEIAHCDLIAPESPASGRVGVDSLSSAQYDPGATSRRLDPIAVTTVPSLSSSSQTQTDPNELVKPSEPPDSEHRPRSVSPSDSMTSSLFQSALMTQGSERESGGCESKVVDSQGIGGNGRSHSPSGRTTGNDRLPYSPRATEGEPCHRVIVSLATEPIVVDITTSTPQAFPEASTQHQSSSSQTLDRPDSQQPNLEVSVSVGVIACALTATQICAMLDVISVVGSHSDRIAQPPVSRGSSSVPPALSLLDQMSLTMQIRAFVLLLQSAPTSLTSCSSKEARIIPHDALDDFFAHPLVPPKIGHSYVRFVMDTLKADFSVSTILERGSPFPRHAPERSRVSWGVWRKTSSRLGFSVGDLSACAFCVSNNSRPTHESGETFVLPILLTDLLLSTQYHPEHRPLPVIGRHLDTSPESIRRAFSTLPEFEVLDWTSPDHRVSQAKLSFWRVKPPPGHRRSHRKHGEGSPVSSPMVSSPETMTGEISANQSQPAISGQVLVVSPKDPETDITPGSTSTSVSIAPIHIFVDMGSNKTALEFLEILSSRRSSSKMDLSSSRSSSSSPEGETLGGAYGHNNSGEPTPVSSPHRRTLEPIHLQGLDELNLSEDYLSKEPAPGRLSPKPSVHRHSQWEVKDPSHRNGLAEFDVNFAMVRIQLRCPSPSPHLQRSGAMVLDIHGLKLTTGNGGINDHQFGTKVQPTHRTPGSSDNHLVTAEWRALLLSCSSAGAAIAQCFCSIGPLSSAVNDRAPPSLDHIRFLDDAPLGRRFAVIKLSRNSPSSQRQSSNRLPTFVIEADIPSMCLSLSKPLFDGLQFWIDDVTRSLERTETQSGNEGSSRNPSLVGSRFFSSSKQGSVEVSLDESSPNYNESLTESIVKVTISEASVRLLVPHQSEGAPPSVEPFDILVSDVDALLESKPEGKDVTVITLSIMGVTVLDAVNPFPFPVLDLTAPHSLFSNPKPLVKLRFSSLTLPETASKESRVKLTLHGFTLNILPDTKRMDALAAFARSPQGVFESVVPTERTQIAIKIGEGSVRLFAPNNNGAFVLHLGELDLSTEMVGDSPDIRLRIAGRALTALFADNHLEAVQDSSGPSRPGAQDALYWKACNWLLGLALCSTLAKKLGYALIGEVSNLALAIRRSNSVSTQSEVVIDRIAVRIHLCADTGSALGLFFGDFGTAFKERPDQPNSIPESQPRTPTVVSAKRNSLGELAYPIDQHAFRSVPEVGAAPDMINDDLPSNLDYLDVSFGTAAGLRELDDDDLDTDDSSQSEITGVANPSSHPTDKNIISRVGGETVKLLDPSGLQTVENFFNTLPALVEASPRLAEELSRVVIRDGDVALFLYEGYDWAATRKAVEDEVKKMKRRLTRIKQLVASGQAYDPSIDPTNTLLFNSIHVGLDQDADEMDPDALIAAIDEQLKEDTDAGSVSSWQSLRPSPSGRPGVPQPRLRGRRLTRSRSPSIEIRLSGLFSEAIKYVPNGNFVTRTFATVRDAEILDHVKTSTWRKFLTALRSDSRGNIRETGSNMVRIELCSVLPVPGNTSEETRLRAKILPLRLHVDQDALDFLKKFFNFQNPTATPDPGPKDETYLQRAEVFPVALKLDYKPRRVDYRALRDGRTIELMNFFHFDGAEMTLRHITLFGVAGWPRFFDMLNDLWTPDVKATQLADVISGVSPIRSVVNVGSGVADLVLLPIAQYRKDGRVVRGLQKGTKAFVRSTAMEAVKLGAQLATGTQVILEQAENVLGSKFNETVLAETVSHPSENVFDAGTDDWASNDESTDPISKYAEQPVDIRDGIETAYTSMRRNLSSAAQTILAVPMEVFERSGSEAPVIRAVPIAVLRPMIGASEAVSKTLLGLHNSMDPEIRHENAAKYKHR